MSLKVSELSVGYSKGRTVLEDVNVEVGRGELVGLLGPNGSGKSTLIKVISGIVKHQDGSIVWGGAVDLARLSRREVAKIVAYVPQSIDLTFTLDVREAVLLGRTPHFGSKPTEEDWAHVDDAIRQVGLEEISERRVTQLSGGQGQRVLIARALAQNGSVLLLDEPTSALDIKYQWQTLTIARRVTRERGVAGLISIHDLNQAARFTDRLVVVHEGRIVASGAPSEVLTAQLIEQVYGIRVEVTEYKGFVEVHPIATDDAGELTPHEESDDAKVLVGL